MKKLLFIAGISMAVLANIGLADELENNDTQVQTQVKSQQSKNTFKVDEEEAVNMSKQDWINLRSRMNENKESHFQAALQLDSAEERKFHREAAKNLDELKKKIDHRRWIEKEGGWGIPAQVDLPLLTFMSLDGFEGAKNTAIIQTGLRLGISKRQFHPNLEFRALTGVGYAYSEAGSSAYFPFALEVGWANDYRRHPRILAGVSYEYSTDFEKTEVYLTVSPFKDDNWSIRASYGLSGGMKLDTPAISGNKITTQKAMIDANSFYSVGIVFVY